jgi:hypothetical protein
VLPALGGVITSDCGNNALKRSGGGACGECGLAEREARGVEILRGVILGDGFGKGDCCWDAVLQGGICF